MTMPDRIWAWEFKVDPNTSHHRGFWDDDQSECPEGSPEYARVTPVSITLPRAEVEALMEAAQCAAHELISARRFMCVYQLEKSLSTLQERMK